MSAASDTWESIVLGDNAVRLDSLLTAKALARLSDERGECRIAMRSLADAVGYRDSAGRTVSTVQRGLAGLTSLGYVMRLNAGAPRNERGHYRLVVPAVQLVAA